MATCHIKYDPYLSTILTEVDPTVESIIESKLRWKDRSKEYISRFKGVNFSNYYENCYDSKSRKFLSGLLPKVKDILVRHGYEVQILGDPTSSVLFEDGVLPPWLWRHQVEAVKKCRDYTRGILSMPTGSGKTVVAGVLVSQVPKEVPVLITVPTATLMMTMQSTLEKLINETVGVVGDSCEDWRRVTVGIINSLSRPRNISYLSQVKLLIFDEAHHSASSLYREVLSYCSSVQNIYGLTATPIRGSGDQIVLEGVCGPVIYTVSEQELSCHQITTLPTCLFIKHNIEKTIYPKHIQGRLYATPNGDPDPSDVYETSIVNNAQRNEMIVDIAIEYLNISQLPMLILVKTLKHGKIIKELFAAKGYDIPFVYGQSSKKTRDKYLEALRQGTQKVLIASSIFNEGEDIKNLGLCINAAGGRSKKEVIQKLGRVVRSHPGKNYAIYIDFYDIAEYYLTSASRDRKFAIEERYGKDRITVANYPQVKRALVSLVRSEHES